MTKQEQIAELMNRHIAHRESDIYPTYIFIKHKLCVKESEIAEWEQVIRDAMSLDGKLYARDKIRELRKR